MSFSHNIDQFAGARPAVGLLVCFLLLGAAGCGQKVEGQSRAGKNAAGPPAPAVDVVRARAGLLRQELEYTGTTRPTREISVRARTEGRLFDFTVDVGDRVKRGQVVGRLDDSLLQASLKEAQAELSNREAEVSSARTQIGQARTRVEQARLDLIQKRSDSKRVVSLYAEGYEARRTAEQSVVAVRVAEQVLKSTQQQVRDQEAALRSAQARVRAQQAVIAQEKERLSYAVLRSPIDGWVTQRMTEAGNLIQPGGELLRVGDFQIAQVDVQVSELELAGIAVGMPVRVRLDALGGPSRAGRVDRISPQADPVSRLVPVAVTLENGDGRIGAGLLARVRFGRNAPERVLVPETALQAGPREGRRGGGVPTANAPGGSPRTSDPPADGSSRSDDETESGEVFVLVGGPVAPDQYKVEARRVRIGARTDGQAEIIEGLDAGERVVARSSRPLKEGDLVQPSVLSKEALEPAQPGAAPRREGESGPAESPDVPRGSGSPSSGDAGQPGTSQGPGGGSQGGGARPSFGGEGPGAAGSGSGSLPGVGAPGGGSTGSGAGGSSGLGGSGSSSGGGVSGSGAGGGTRAPGVRTPGGPSSSGLPPAGGSFASPGAGGTSGAGGTAGQGGGSGFGGSSGFGGGGRAGGTRSTGPGGGR